MMNLTAKFEKGERFAIASNVYQYDKNRTLEVDGINLPDGYIEVQFSEDERQGESIQKMGTVSGGKLTVDVPNELTFDETKTSDYFIWAFIYAEDEQIGITVYKILMNVIARPGTGRTAEPDTGNPFGDALQEVKKEVEKSKRYSESAKEFSDSAKGFSEQASDSKDEAKRIKSEVVDLANGFDAKVNESIETITQTGTEQVGAVEQAGKQQTQTVNDAGSKQVQAVTDEGVKQKQELLKETELFKSDREQITKNKGDILKLAIKPEASGNPVITKDSADFEPASLELRGSTTQIQTEGRNLFDEELNINRTGAVNFINNEIWLKGTGKQIDIAKPFKFKEGIPNGYISITKKMPCDISILELPSYKIIGKIQAGTLNKELQKPILSNFSYYIVASGFPENQTLTFNIQIEKGSFPTPYEPYTNGEPSPSPNHPQKIANGEWDNISDTGKNLLLYPYYESTVTKNGVTFTVNNDGTVIVNGEASRITDFILAQKSINLTDKQFISGCPKGGGVNYSLLLYTNDSEICDVGNGIKGINMNDVTIVIRIGEKTSCHNLVFKPQIELGTTPTTYEPYKGFTETLPQKIQLSKWDKIKFIDEVWVKENETIIMDFNGWQKGIIGTHSNGQKYISVPLYNGVKCMALSTNYTPSEWTQKNNYIYMVSQNTLVITDNRFTDKETAINILKEEKCLVYYKSATPTYEVLPLETQEVLNKITTFYPNTVLQTNEGITLDLRYVADTKLYVDNKLNENVNKLKTAIISAGGM